MSARLDVPLPAGVEWADDWQAPVERPWRVIRSVERRIDGTEVFVFAEAVQYSDGTFDRNGDAPHVTVDTVGYAALTSAQARQFAALIADAAGIVDQWVTP
jgi:hypothetical protein